MKGQTRVKVLFALLAVTMLLAACTTTPLATQATTAAPVATTAPAETPNSSEPPSAKPIRTLSILGDTWGGFKYWDTRDTQESWKYFLNLLKNANLELKIEAIDGAQWATVIQTRLASGDLPDLVMLNGVDPNTINSLGKAGTFLDCVPLVKQYSNGNIEKMESQFEFKLWAGFKNPDGTCYFVPGIYKMVYKNYPYFSMLGPMIRYDWLQKLNLSMPATIDELTADLKAFQDQDVNGNGKKDEVAVVDSGNWFSGFGPLFGLMGGNYQTDITDDTVKSPWEMKAKLITYINWLKEMIADGLISKDAIGKPTDYVNQMIQSDTVALQMGWNGTSFYDPPVASFNGHYVGIVTPKDPTDFYTSGNGSTSVNTMTAITKFCKDPQAAIDLFNVIYTQEFYIDARFGVTGVSNTIENGIVYPNDGLGGEAYDLPNKSNLAAVTQNILPMFRIEDARNFERQMGADATIAKLRNDTGYKYCVQQPGGPKIAVYYWGGAPYQCNILSTDDQTFITEKLTDLTTYMNETMTKLVLGEYSTDNLDTYVNKMKQLGLDDVIKIYQKAHDAYMADNK